MNGRIALAPPASAMADDQFPAYLAACESLGFDTIWLSDIPLGPLGDPLLSLAQLDRPSNGRLLLSLVPGLGQPAERRALGYDTGDSSRSVTQTMRRSRCSGHSSGRP